MRARGLKRGEEFLADEDDGVAPYAAAWIETARWFLKLMSRRRSRPMRARGLKRGEGGADRRPAHLALMRVRGLKCRGRWRPHHPCAVAPHSAGGAAGTG